jgi:copper chaperone CopZ
MFKKILSLAVFTCLLTLSVSAKDIQKANLTAKMECNSCKNKIEKTLKSTKGVEKVNVTLKDQSVKVEYDKDVVSEAQLVEVINKADANFSCKKADSKDCCKEGKQDAKLQKGKKDGASCDKSNCEKKCNK